MDAVPNQRTRPSRVRPDAPVDVSLGVVLFTIATLALAAPLALIFAIVAAVAPAIPWWIGPIGALMVAAAMVWRRLQRAHDVVVDRLTAHTATVTSVRLTNMVRGLTLAAGVEEPDALVLNDDAVNAIAVARNNSATIAVSSGMLERLEPVELEGVVAEMLVRLRNGDAEAATIGVAAFRLPILGPLSALASGPVSAFGLGRLLDDSRHVDADLEAVALTRYPPGLLQALTKAKGTEHRLGDVDHGIDELWLIDPADNASTHSEAIRSALDLRIDVLTEL